MPDKRGLTVYMYTVDSEIFARLKFRELGKKYISRVFIFANQPGATALKLLVLTSVVLSNSVLKTVSSNLPAQEVLFKQRLSKRCFGAKSWAHKKRCLTKRCLEAGLCDAVCVSHAFVIVMTRFYRIVTPQKTGTNHKPQRTIV